MSGKSDRIKDDQIIEIRENRGKEFEEKYSDFLSELKAMPKGTTEEKEARWKFFEAYPLKNEFKLELMDAFRPGALRKLQRRMAKSEQTDTSDWDIASYKHKDELDPVIFLETVKEVISTFTGVRSDGSELRLLACIGQIYPQRAGDESAKNELQEKGVSDSKLPRDNKRNIVRLAKEVNTLWDKNPNSGTREEILLQILKEGKIECAKKDLELVRQLIFNSTLVWSIDHPESEDGTPSKDNLEDGRDYYQEVEEQDQTGIPFLDLICKNLEECWENIESAKRLREKRFIQMFLTKDILKVLKLDEQKKPFTEEPAGNEEFYLSLEPHGTVLYQKMFLKEYLVRAFIENPGNFYEVYAKLLRKDFDFSDKLLTELIGKDKTAVSRGRKEYQTTMEGLYHYYINNQ